MLHFLPWATHALRVPSIVVVVVVYIAIYLHFAAKMWIDSVALTFLLHYGVNFRCPLGLFRVLVLPLACCLLPVPVAERHSAGCLPIFVSHCLSLFISLSFSLPVTPSLWSVECLLNLNTGRTRNHLQLGGNWIKSKLHNYAQLISWLTHPASSFYTLKRLKTAACCCRF